MKIPLSSQKFILQMSALFFIFSIPLLTQADRIENLLKEGENADAHFQLCTTLMNQATQDADKDLLQKAITECQETIHLNPLHGEAHDNLAYCYYILRDYQKSYVYYRKAEVMGIKNEFLKERLLPKIKPPPQKQKKPPLPSTSTPQTQEEDDDVLERELMKNEE
ncbi:MAG: hypothetical protein HYS07_11400 [Chlamydiae bacterium]|nr:hypothetical protein [Chlamydiota bacterium]MBI3278092.1 hypothetical protein [Chlamydiota bacterium]